MKCLFNAMISVLLVLCVNGCGAIYDYEGDCSVHYRVRFSYDYNMKNSDAFRHEVESVSLFVFDKLGGLVWSGNGNAASLASEGYTMSVDVPPGKYDMVAWGGLDGGDAFSLAASPSGVTSKEDLVCRLSRDSKGVVDREVCRLFHGYAEDVEFGDSYGVVDVPLFLMKYTNTVRVMLLHFNGEPMDKDKFSFSVTDRNGLMNYDYGMLDDGMLTYGDWFCANVTTDEPDGTGDVSLDSKAGTVTSASAVIAETVIGRVMMRNDPMLVVTRLTDDEEIIRINLRRYMLLVKGNYNRQMGDQEYLDRQDDYTITFYLDSDNSWYMASGIYINNWYVVPEQNENI